MLVYSRTRDEFIVDVRNRGIEHEIAKQFVQKTKRYASHAEIKAWRNSLEHMAAVLDDDSMPGNMGVGVEFGIPQSSKRIDFILSGNSEGGSANLIIVELKQWSSSSVSEKDGLIFANRGGTAVTEGAHPCYQAWSYAALLEGFSEPVYSDAVALSPCAYLHNHPDDGQINHPAYKPYIEKAPLFLKGKDEQERLRRFISLHVKSGDNAALLYRIDDGRIRPSKMLADSLAGMLKGNVEFVLVDEQKVVFENCVASAGKATPANREVVLVKGGPGTGKSVVAINLLSTLLRQGLNARYVSKNAAPREVFKQKLAPGMRRAMIANLFSGSGSFIETAPDDFSALIVDEAHRLNLKSGLYGNLGENQAKELMRSSPCTIFFFDDDQIVTLQDIGNSGQLKAWAEETGAHISEFELASQFRCGGSDGYLAWLDNVLDLRETANVEQQDYDFRVFDSPSEMHAAVKNANEGNNRSRVVAGYCWDWKSKRDPDAYDIELEAFDYRRQWNLDKHGSLWITEPDSIEQVGCIHTCQGLELDYVGVIVGPDFIVRDGVVQTDASARSSQDRSIRGYKTLMKTAEVETKFRVDRIIKNTYKTLMTRGMKGCYVFCVDPETQQYFNVRSSR